MGSFRKVRNAFPLMTVGGLYKHQRAVTSDKRVFILTRRLLQGSNVTAQIHGRAMLQHRGML